MKNCWKILDIEETTDVDIIRRAYLALLPSFHPEPIRRVLNNFVRRMRRRYGLRSRLLNLFGNQKNMR
ncbi:DnaJ-class chaperone [Escherichia coli]|uniref:DnaJ-class chaperone n=1 Tax=Escherichia coli TaxID=562 RepID=A0A376P3Q5_ECOLX|nr:DnaJ-class chaperone [Escherichia coli]